MPPIFYVPMPSDLAHAYRQGAPDANGQLPQIVTSDGGGNQCRHCLTIIPEGQEMLLLAYRPFPAPDAFAEVGPVYICNADCSAFSGSDVPASVLASAQFLIRGYGDDNRIVYGTGRVVDTSQIAGVATDIFSDTKVAYLHLRSACNNCYQARIERAAD